MYCAGVDTKQIIHVVPAIPPNEAADPQVESALPVVQVRIAPPFAGVATRKYTAGSTTGEYSRERSGHAASAFLRPR